MLTQEWYTSWRSLAAWGGLRERYSDMVKYATFVSPLLHILFETIWYI